MNISKLTFTPKYTFPGFSKKALTVRLNDIDSDIANDFIKEYMNLPEIPPDTFEKEDKNDEKIARFLLNNFESQEFNRIKDNIQTKLW